MTSTNAARCCVVCVASALAASAAAQAILTRLTIRTDVPCADPNDPPPWYTGVGSGDIPIVPPELDFVWGRQRIDIVSDRASLMPLRDLNRPPVFDPNLEPIELYANFVSTPNDVPNTDQIGSPNSTLEILSATTTSRLVETEWRDTSLNPGVGFTAWQFAIEFHEELGDLTLAPLPGIPAEMVAVCSLEVEFRNVITGGATVSSLDFQVYQQIPEPACLINMGLFSFLALRRILG